MKSFKIVNTILLCMAITLASCDGEDGRPGADGDPGESITGAPGADGINCWDLNGNGVADVDSEDLNDDGTVDINDCEGTDGIDGNANVQKFDTLLDGFSGHLLELKMPIPLEERENYAFFFYIQLNDQLAETIWYPVPGPLQSNDIYARVFYFTYIDEGNIDLMVNGNDLFVNFYDTFDNTEHEVSEGEYILFRTLAIEYSNMGAKGNKASLESTLKAAGVDTSDYNAMADYFGLE